MATDSHTHNNLEIVGTTEFRQNFKRSCLPFFGLFRFVLVTLNIKDVVNLADV